jgi:hypothetical protein
MVTLLRLLWNLAATCLPIIGRLAILDLPGNRITQGNSPSPIPVFDTPLLFHQKLSLISGLQNHGPDSYLISNTVEFHIKDQRQETDNREGRAILNGI